MRYIPVAHLFGWLLLLMAVAMLVPLAVAISHAEHRSAIAFSLMIIGAAFVGGSLVLALRGRSAMSSGRQVILLLGVVWFLVPIGAAAPFLLSGVVTTPVSALFEAVSGLTTTGATVLSDLTDVPRAIIIWRAQLQWMGGLITILGLSALVSPRGTSPRLALGSDRPRNGARLQVLLTRGALQTIIPLYGVLTVACYAGLLLAGLPLLDSASLAMSSISTGGFLARNGTIELYGSPTTELILALAMFAGAVSPLWLSARLGGAPRDAERDHEPYWILAAIAVVSFFVARHILANSPGPGFWEFYRVLASAVATATSFITTSGLAISQKGHETLPYLVVLVICLVGGGRYSTAGGLKFHRVGELFRFCAMEVYHLIYPHSSFLSRASSADRRQAAIMGALWASFAVTIVVAMILVFVLAAEGLGLLAALLAAFSAIGNIGPAYTLTVVPGLDVAPAFGDMSATSQIALCFGMIFGRFEVLALLALFNLAYWRP